MLYTAQPLCNDNLQVKLSKQISPERAEQHTQTDWTVHRSAQLTSLATVLFGSSEPSHLFTFIEARLDCGGVR